MDRGDTTSQYKTWSGAGLEETDQFQLLEEKIDKLITTIKGLRAEKDALNEKIQIQEERLTDLTREVESLKTSRDKARQRIVSLLEKIEQIEG